MHYEIEPAIHYRGTPVVLLGTLSEDGTANISPMSSAWWLGWSCMIGLDASSKTVENLEREGECTLNLASCGTAAAVNRLARTTGSRKVPMHKRLLGYRHVADKAGHAELTLAPSVHVRARRVAECLVQLEAEVVRIRPFGKRDQRLAIPACAVELVIRKAHADPSILAGSDRIDAERWEPLPMSFRHLFVRGESVGQSRLAHGDESLYAPWKRTGASAVAAKVFGAVAQRRYAVSEPTETDDEPTSA